MKVSFMKSKADILEESIKYFKFRDAEKMYFNYLCEDYSVSKAVDIFFNNTDIRYLNTNKKVLLENIKNNLKLSLKEDASFPKDSSSTGYFGKKDNNLNNSSVDGTDPCAVIYATFKVTVIVNDDFSITVTTPENESFTTRRYDSEESAYNFIRNKLFTKLMNKY